MQGAFKKLCKRKCIDTNLKPGKIQFQKSPTSNDVDENYQKY